MHLMEGTNKMNGIQRQQKQFQWMNVTKPASASAGMKM